MYIVPNSPISPNYVGGGPAIYYEQLTSLIELGVEVHLWHFCYESRREELERFIETDQAWSYVTSMCHSVHRSTIPDSPTYSERAFNKLANKFIGPEIRNPVLRGKCFPILRGLIKDIRPDLIWAQHLVSAQVALLQRSVPVVYSHHDWLYRVKGHGRKGRDNGMKMIEEETARLASAVISGSKVECQTLEQAGCTNVHYIPVAYEPVALESSDRNTGVRLVHLGGAGTTANRVGLQRFFDIVWKEVDLPPKDLWIIGDMSVAPPALKDHLTQVTATGYVNDLSSVLRPYDIHFIPWEDDTGQRTRLVCAFNFKQAVVAVRRSVTCFPEVVSEYNCLLVDSLDEMPHTIDRLLRDERLRTLLADNARRTFEKHFTRDALLPRYGRVLDSLCVNVLAEAPGHAAMVSDSAVKLN